MTAIIIVLIFAALMLLISYFCYRLAFYSPIKEQNEIHNFPSGQQHRVFAEGMRQTVDALAALPFEQVFITSRDGVRLAARYYHAAEGAPLAICFHGYRSTAVRDFSGGARYCMAKGQNILLVDERAQGLSGGHTITFGIKERYDCLDWVEYGIKRFGAETPIYLYGVSMGAATVLLAAGLPKLPQNVCAVVADSPYSSAAGIIKKVCRDIKVPPTTAMFFLRLGARVFGHFRLADGEVQEAVIRAKVPLLIIHGEADHFVPCAMSRQMKAVCPALRLETFPDAGHGISYLVDKERYCRIIDEFMPQQ